MIDCCLDMLLLLLLLGRLTAFTIKDRIRVHSKFRSGWLDHRCRKVGSRGKPKANQTRVHLEADIEPRFPSSFALLDQTSVQKTLRPEGKAASGETLQGLI